LIIVIGGFMDATGVVLIMNDENPLNAARGIILGMLISTTIWLVIIAGAILAIKKLM
jgi:hypothetical protein